MVHWSYLILAGSISFAAGVKCTIFILSLANRIRAIHEAAKDKQEGKNVECKIGVISVKTDDKKRYLASSN